MGKMPGSYIRPKTDAPKKGEIWYADALLFNDGIHSKDRPVLIKSRDGQTFTCFKCTTQESSFRQRYEITDLVEAGLDRRTFIDYDTIRIDRSKLLFKRGCLSEEDRAAFGRL